MLQEWQKQHRFLPLTYLEAKAEKPLVIKLDKKWLFVCKPQSPFVFASLVDIELGVFAELEKWIRKKPRKEETKLQKSKKIFELSFYLIELLWQVSHDYYKSKRKKKKYKEFLFALGKSDIGQIIEITQTLLNYNSRIKKKNRVPGKLECHTRARFVDRWHGILTGEVRARTFLELVHETEAENTKEIQRFEESKRRDKAQRIPS